VFELNIAMVVNTPKFPDRPAPGLLMHCGVPDPITIDSPVPWRSDIRMFGPYEISLWALSGRSIMKLVIPAGYEAWVSNGSWIKVEYASVAGFHLSQAPVLFAKKYNTVLSKEP
jgi:hypothetical protein